MMSLPQIKKLLKKTLRETEDEAILNHIDTTTPEFKALMLKLRNKMLIDMGTPVSDYDEYLESLKDIGRKKYQAKKDAFVKEVKQEVKDETVLATWESLPDKPAIPTTEEIKSVAIEVVSEAIRKLPPAPAPVIEKPVIEKTIEVYDDTKMKEAFEDLSFKVQQIKIPEIPAPLDVKKFKESITDEYKFYFQESINIMDMPDFRKLAMGLQGQIDSLGSGSNGSVAGFTGSIQINQGGVLGSDTKAIWNFTTHAMNANIDMGTFT